MVSTVGQSLSASSFAAVLPLQSGVPSQGFGLPGSPPLPALPAVTAASTGIELEVLTNSCGANEVQNFFELINHGSTAVPLSAITIKFWVDDTSGQTVVPHVYTGGCVADAGNPSCVHQLTGVTASSTQFSPACGASPSAQANWEITISDTDGSTLPPGGTWSNLQSEINLANYANFSPGAADWYSGCLTGTSYAPSVRYAVYVNGSLVTASPGVPPSCRAVTGTQVIQGNTLPPTATTSLVGSLPGTTELSLGIALPLQTGGAPGSGALPLVTFIQQVSNPTSPPSIARQYMTTAQFAAAYGPSSAAYTALQSFVTANGMSIVRTFGGRNLLAVSGTVAAVETAFHVTLDVYRRPDGSTFYAPANAPSVNLSVPILGLVGLDNFSPMIPAGGSSPTSCSQFPVDFVPPDSLTTERQYFGPDFRNAYFASCASTLPFGQGQTVGLVEACGYTPSDITDYANGLVSSGPGPIPGLATSFPQNITQEVGIVSTSLPFSPSTSCGDSGEVTLDIDMVIAMAPAANIIVYEQGTFPNAALLAQIADDDTAKTISSSYAWSPSTSNEALIIQGIMQQYAAQGQSYFNASMDLGAAIPDPYDPSVSPPLPNIVEPMIDSSLETTVGGTELTTSGTGGALGSYVSETTWNDILYRSGNSVTTGGFASGNGILPVLPLPTYQVGINAGNSEVTNNPTNARMIPDVSWTADNIAIVFEGAEQCTGGTSAASPLWAGFAALINEQAGPTRGPIGFANPTLYFLASNPTTYALNFHDIADGSNNDWFDDGLAGTGGAPGTEAVTLYGTPYSPAVGASEAPGLYHAFSGYDMATGLGTPTCSLVTTLPPQSCMPGTSLSALINGANVTAYMPNGAYGEATTGVSVIAVEGTGTSTTISTPSDAFINTCAGNSLTQAVVCTGNVADINGNDVYIIDGLASPPSIIQSMQSAGVSNESFSGGICTTCNVALDQLHNTGFLSVGDGAAFQLLNLPSRPSPTAPLPNSASFGSNLFQTFQPDTSEDIVVDEVRGLVLSPNEQNDFQLLNTTNGQVFNFSPTGVTPPDGPVIVAGTPSGTNASNYGEFDATAEDCSTGIALATNEYGDSTTTGGTGGPASLFLTDLNQAQFTVATPSTSTWASGQSSTPGGPITTPTSTVFPIPEFTGLAFGISGAAVDSNGSHLGVVAGEFGTEVPGGNLFGLIQLPSASVPGSAPQLVDWVLATIPNTPNDNLPWAMGEDPHTLTIYTSPTNHQPYAIFEDDAFGTGQRTWLAVVDLLALQALPGRTVYPGATQPHVLPNPLPSCTTGAGGVLAAPNPPGCIVRFVAVAP